MIISKSCFPNIFISAFCIVFSLSVHPSVFAGGEKRTLLDCSQIEDETERLKCYDELVRKNPKQAAKIVDQSDAEAESKSVDVSYLSKLWDLDESKPRKKFVILTHRSNYILPYSYNSRPNNEPFDEAVSDENLRKAEVKFQLSFKMKFLQDVFDWQDRLDVPADLWFGYTQQSFWQFYNFADSSPFRDTNYEPELLLNFRTNTKIPFLGLTNRIINLGFNHQSNGRSDPFSRSWNRIVMNLGLEKGDFVLLIKPWYRIHENEAEDDNPNIEDYIGYGEIWGYYFWKRQRFGLMLRDNLKTHNNRGSVQAEWSFPIFGRINGHIQYFYGYGESLLDYDHSVNRIGIGFILNDWD